MGLVKDALKAIVRIDKNLSRLCAMLKAPDIGADNFTKHEEKRNLHDLPLFTRLHYESVFPYPDQLTLGGRFAAVRHFYNLKQYDVAEALSVTPSYVSRMESDLVIPSATILRFFSLTYRIDEHWITTGELPQASESPSIAMGNVNPLSGFDGKLSIKESMDRVRQAQIESQPSLREEEAF